jgi:N-acetylmuramoyl-L-alanine amidase
MGKWTDANGVTVLHYPTSARSKEIAELFQGHLVKLTCWRDRGIKARGDLSILKFTHMPAIITENGFYTCREQCEEMLRPEIRGVIAHAHVMAIAELEGLQPMVG